MYGRKTINRFSIQQWPVLGVQYPEQISCFISAVLEFEHQCCEDYTTPKNQLMKIFRKCLLRTFLPQKLSDQQGSVNIFRKSDVPIQAVEYCVFITVSISKLRNPIHQSVDVETRHLAIYNQCNRSYCLHRDAIASYIPRGTVKYIDLFIVPLKDTT